MLSPGPIAAGAAPSTSAGLRHPAFPYALAIFGLGAAAILGALGFEHVGGYLPCALCLMQRTPYYIGVPVAAVAAVAAWMGASRALLLVLFVILAALAVYNTGLAAYHSGVEWGFWEGPASCSPSLSINSAADMLNQLENTHAPSCTDALWRFLGLSFAGWNVLISALLAVLSAAGARMAWTRG